jgi:hypothetical protein
LYFWGKTLEEKAPVTPAQTTTEATVKNDSLDSIEADLNIDQDLKGIDADLKAI